MRAIDADALEELFREVIGGIAKKPEMNGNLEHMVRASAMVIEMIQDAPTIEPRCETCEAFNKTRLLISQPQQRWMPCSKELPERNLVVLVTTRWGEVTEGVKLSGNAWFIGRGEENAFDSDIIAWMPLPEPYREGEG